MNYFSCFVYATISLSDAESDDSKTSANKAISYTMYFKHNLPLETRIPVEPVCMENIFMETSAPRNTPKNHY